MKNAVKLWKDYAGGKMLFVGGFMLVLSALLQLETGPQVVAGLYTVGGILLAQIEILTEQVQNQ